MAIQRGWQFAMTSAKNDINVDESFENLIAEAMRIKYGVEMSDEEMDPILLEQESLQSEIDAKEKLKNQSSSKRDYAIELDIDSDWEPAQETSNENERTERSESGGKKHLKRKNVEDIEEEDLMFKERKNNKRGHSREDQPDAPKTKGLLSRIFGMCCLSTD